MKTSENTARQALEELLAAARAFADETSAGVDADALSARLMHAMDAAEGAEVTGPMASVAKIWAVLKGAQIAYQDDCNLDFTGAISALLDYLYPVAVTMPEQ